MTKQFYKSGQISVTNNIHYQLCHWVTDNRCWARALPGVPDICSTPPPPIFLYRRAAVAAANFWSACPEGSLTKWYFICVVSCFSPSWIFGLHGATQTLLTYWLQFFQNHKIAVFLIDCKSQVANKWRSLNSYLFTLCSAYVTWPHRSSESCLV
jgi:hypothetical protein